MHPTPTFLLDCHRYAYTELGVHVLLERFIEDARDGLIAEMTVTTDRAPRPGLLHHGRINLSSTRSRADMVRALEKRNQNGFLDDIDFAGILEQVSWTSLKRWREGEPAVILADVARRTTGRYLVYPYIEEGAINILFGDGESAKSTLALALAISVAAGRNILGYMRGEPRNVLYLDWEATDQDHLERMEALCRGLQMSVPRNVYYRSMKASLPASAAVIRKEVGILGIGLVIADSIGMAGGDEPERAGTKIAIFSAARSLVCTFLGIDHVAHADKSRPYGSVYTRNIARLIWGVSKARSDDGKRLTLRLRNEKINHGRGHKPSAYTLDFESDAAEDELIAVHLAQADMPQVRDLFKAETTGRTWKERIQEVLANNPEGLTVKDIALIVEPDGEGDRFLNICASIKAELNRQACFHSHGSSRDKRWKYEP